MGRSYGEGACLGRGACLVWEAVPNTVPLSTVFLSWQTALPWECGQDYGEGASLKRGYVPKERLHSHRGEAWLGRGDVVWSEA